MATISTALSVIFVGPGLALDGSTLYATAGGDLNASGAYLLGQISGGDTNLSGSLVSMSGALVTQIQSAAGVLSLNNLTGLLTLGGVNGVSVSTSGSTLWLSGTSGFNAATYATIANLLGGDTNLSGALVAASGALVTQIQSAAGVLSLNGVTGLVTIVGASNIGVSTVGTVITVTGSSFPTLSGITLPGGALTATQATFPSGIFFRDTGNYTASGTASVAQLTEVSGFLQTVITNSAPANVVYTTGAQTIPGAKTFAGSNVIATGGSIGVGTVAPAQLVHISGGNLRIDGSGILAGPLNGVGDIAIYRGAAGATVLKVLAATTPNVIRFQNSTDSFAQIGRADSSNDPIGNLVAGDFFLNGNRIHLIGGAIALTVGSSNMVGIGTAGNNAIDKLQVSGGNFRVDGNSYLGITGGNIGFGITVPQEKMHVSGNARFDGSGIIMSNIPGQAPATFTPGGQTFVSGGALYYRGSAGTISLLAPA